MARAKWICVWVKKDFDPIPDHEMEERLAELLDYLFNPKYQQAFSKETSNIDADAAAPLNERETYG